MIRVIVLDYLTRTLNYLLTQVHDVYLDSHAQMDSSVFHDRRPFLLLALISISISAFDAPVTLRPSAIVFLLHNF
jgi:hypothetical protein